MSINIPKTHDHHAYLIIGDLFGSLEELWSDISKELGVEKVANIDSWIYETDVFGIDDSKVLQEKQSRMPVSNKYYVILVSCQRMTREAQNSLLKKFEEPSKATRIFLTVPSREMLLPTLLSRLTEVTYEESRKVERKGDIEVEEFLKLSLSKRLSAVESIIKDKDRLSAYTLLNNLEIALSKDLKKSDKKVVYALGEVEKARRHIHDRSPSIKLLLEHVCLVLPR